MTDIDDAWLVRLKCAQREHDAARAAFDSASCQPYGPVFDWDTFTAAADRLHAAGETLLAIALEGQ